MHSLTSLTPKNECRSICTLQFWNEWRSCFAQILGVHSWVALKRVALLNWLETTYEQEKLRAYCPNIYPVANYKRMQFQCHFLNVNWVGGEKWKLNQLCKKSICVKWKSETWDVYFFLRKCKRKRRKQRYFHKIIDINSINADRFHFKTHQIFKGIAA